MVHKIQIFIADSIGVVRRGIRAMLEDRPDLEIVGEAGDGAGALRAIVALKPQLVVLDYAMPELGGLEVARILRDSLPKTGLLMFTMHEGEDILAEALGAGVHGYLLKSDAGAHLVEAIEQVAQRRAFISPRMLAAGYRCTVRRAAAWTLSPREREVVRLVAEGMTNKSIGRELGVTLKTIETHRTSAMRKLGLTNVVQMVRYAVRNNFVQP